MAAKGLSDGYLLELYRTYIGEPDDRRDVYLGFGLFLGGIAIATAAFLLFIWSSTLEARSSSFFAWVRPAYALGMLSLPVTMLGIVVLLPSERRVQYASFTGAAITLIAVVGFWLLYPSDWNFYESGDAAFSTVHVVAIYAIGLASITASTGAALIAHYLDLAANAEVTETRYVAESKSDTESYTDEEIQQDIDQAMEDVELSWGGVEKTEHRRLTFSDNEFEDADVEFTAKKTRSTGVDAQVAGLKGLKGGETKTATSSGTVDDQTQKLKELRQKQEAEAKATASTDDSGPVSGLLGRLRGN